MVVSSIFSLAASKRGRKRVSEGEAATTPNFPSPDVERCRVFLDRDIEYASSPLNLFGH